MVFFMNYIKTVFFISVFILFHTFAFASEYSVLKIPVTQDGLYRITQADLSDSGITDAASIDPSTFQIFNLGKEIAIKTVTDKEGYAVEFFAQGIDNQFTGTNVYWLEWGDSQGRRINAIDGKLTGSGEKIDYFDETLYIEENHFLWEKTPNAPEQDYCFWEKIEYSGSASREYYVTVNSPVQGKTAVIRIIYQGRSSVNRYTSVKLNGTQIGEDSWSNDAAHIQETVVSSDILNDGINTVTIEFSGAALDVLYLNRIEITYPRKPESVNNSLVSDIEGEGRIQMEISDFTKSDIRIYDITEPENVKEIQNISVISDENSCKAVFEDDISGKKRYYALSSDRIKKPSGISVYKSADLKNRENQADYILITSKELLSSLEPLCQHRENQGLWVKKVCTEDIFNEFGFGLFNPQSLKDFLKYAYENWKSPAPVYVLLAGDANTDYRDYLGSGKADKVPTHLSVTSLGLTPDDNWYVYGNDLMPYMMIGRITGSSPEMISRTVNKIIEYENSQEYPESVLLAAYNGAEFENVSESLIPFVPSDFTVNKVYGSSDSVNKIISGINTGELITNYVGHGNVTNWGAMFDASNIASLNNNRKLTFVISMSCLNGYFSQPFKYSISEEFLMADDKGAVAVFSPSGLGQTWDLDILNKEIFSDIFEKQNSVIGKIVAQAKISAYKKGVSQEILKMFNLLGDPATRLKIIFPGDTDGNGEPGLEDVIIVLKILAGFKEPVNMKSDVNKNGKIDFAEAIYLLQRISVADTIHP